MNPTPLHGTDGSAPLGYHHVRRDRLRTVIDAAGLSHTAAAAALGVDRSHLYGILDGRVRRPGVRFMDALRNTFPDDYDQLVVWVTDNNDRLGETG